MEKVEIVQIIVGALGIIMTELEERIENLGVGIKIDKLQRKTALLGTPRILRSAEN